jgi:transcriptional regulator with XRE-family HTH domain
MILRGGKTMPTQGEILRDLRLERKMTMQELADYLKVSKQTINSWEKDFRNYIILNL